MWNYRLVRQRIRKRGSDEMFYAVHEAYYDKNDKVWAITTNPSAPRGDNRDEVLSVLARMMRDVLRAPVLDFNKIPEKGAKDPIEEDAEAKKKRKKRKKP